MIGFHLLVLLLNTPGDEPSVVERFFHFGIGIPLSALLLILALRSSGEHRAARLGFALCALLFTLSASIVQIALALGQSPQSLIVILAGDFAFCAGAAWPVTVLGLWATGSYPSTWRRQVGRVVFVAAVCSAFLLSFARITGLLRWLADDVWTLENPQEGLDINAFNGLFFLWLGALVFLPGRLRGRLSWISVAALLIGIALANLHAWEETLTYSPEWLHSATLFTKAFSVLLIIAGGLFEFSHFRFSDIFAQQGLRILLGALLALASSILARSIFGSWLGENVHSRALEIVGFAVIVWLAIICFAKITMLIDWLVDRQIFRQADYQLALTSFRETIATESDPVRISHTGEEFVRSALRIEDAVICASDTPMIVSAGPVGAESVREWKFPIQKGEEPAAFCLKISLGPSRQTLFNAEIDFLREVCLAIGRRLEATDREKENIERARREAQLVKQLVEAELRALRAQINPHFLFNSLNSVAALIGAEPQAAEEMVIRLAKIFRHVLTYHDRPFSSVKEEISFLKTYLEIEKVRFGERLQVKFDVQDSVAHLSVPTLILQPLVENSIKHGLGSKVGENQLIIRARQQMEHLELSVEDNGVGANLEKKHSRHSSTGLGLRNVEDRLQTVYRGGARFTFESQPRIGSLAKIFIPIQASHEKTALVTH